MKTQKLSKAQKRKVDIMSDGSPHPLIIELESAGHWNQHPAIKALEKRDLIKVVVDAGYYSRWISTTSLPPIDKGCYNKKVRR